MNRITDTASPPTKFSSRREYIPEMSYINLRMFRDSVVTEGGLNEYSTRISAFSTRSEVAKRWLWLRTECRVSRETKKRNKFYGSLDDAG
jgi:hypothetical protein